VRFEFVRMRPGDHMAWAFAGPGEFAALATSCLMEGAALGERLMYVADRPDPSAVAALSGVTGEDDLRVVSIGEVYGTSGVVDPERQIAYYAAELRAALAAGDCGLRIVADNTSQVSSEPGLAAWRRYELLADQFAATHPATALCAFDARRLCRPARRACRAAPAVVGVGTGAAVPALLHRPHALAGRAGECRVGAQLAVGPGRPTPRDARGARPRRGRS
jgi:MEDS: MEthanogen/methylotroph, DcmR Sensory domain